MSSWSESWIASRRADGKIENVVKLKFVDHAVERYVKRICPDISLLAAKRALEHQLVTPTKHKTVTGESYWLLEDCIAIVKFDRGREINPVCVTIVKFSDVTLPGHCTEQDADPWEEVLREHFSSV